jgi:hypothetical protein
VILLETVHFSATPFEPDVDASSRGVLQQHPAVRAIPRSFSRTDEWLGVRRKEDDCPRPNETSNSEHAIGTRIPILVVVILEDEIQGVSMDSK